MPLAACPAAMLTVLPGRDRCAAGFEVAANYSATHSSGAGTQDVAVRNLYPSQWPGLLWRKRRLYRLFQGIGVLPYWVEGRAGMVRNLIEGPDPIPILRS